MIHVVASHDVMVMPQWVPSYERMVRAHRGDNTDDQYRLWWVERASHGADPGVTCHALRDLVSWVEDGIAPPRSTSYSITRDGGILLADSAAERGGTQPLVQVTVNGGVRADVKVGEKVSF